MVGAVTVHLLQMKEMSLPTAAMQRAMTVTDTERLCTDQYKPRIEVKSVLPFRTKPIIGCICARMSANSHKRKACQWNTNYYDTGVVGPMVASPPEMVF